MQVRKKVNAKQIIAANEYEVFLKARQHSHTTHTLAHLGNKCAEVLRAKACECEEHKKMLRYTALPQTVSACSVDEVLKCLTLIRKKCCKMKIY